MRLAKVATGRRSGLSNSRVGRALELPHHSPRHGNTARRSATHNAEERMSLRCTAGAFGCAFGGNRQDKEFLTRT
jgi:hypothetical protein